MKSGAPLSPIHLGTEIFPSASQPCLLPFLKTDSRSSPFIDFKSFEHLLPRFCEKEKIYFVEGGNRQPFVICNLRPVTRSYAL